MAIFWETGCSIQLQFNLWRVQLCKGKINFQNIEVKLRADRNREDDRNKLKIKLSLSLLYDLWGGSLIGKDHSVSVDKIVDLPAYTISEVAHYLNMPVSTVRCWSVGRDGYEPLIRVPASTPVLLSFLNLTELHILAAIRRKFVVPMPKVRQAMEYLESMAKNQFEKQHPLTNSLLETAGFYSFVDQFEGFISVSQHGQSVIRKIVDAALHRIEFSSTGMPVKLYPYTRPDFSSAPVMIVIDPCLSAGRPVIAGTGITTSTIAERYKAGESVKELARDYERDHEEIEEAIRCELKPAV